MKSMRTPIQNRQSTRRGSRKARRSAFTLLELLIVLGIIVAIAAMVAPNLIGQQQSANIDQTKGQIATIENAFKMKASKNQGTYMEDDTVMALADVWTNNLEQEQQPLLEKVPTDVWGNEFQYSYSSGDLKPRIWSFGPDGQDGTDDDISNMPEDG